MIHHQATLDRLLNLHLEIGRRSKFWTGKRSVSISASLSHAPSITRAINSEIINTLLEELSSFTEKWIPNHPNTIVQNIRGRPVETFPAQSLTRAQLSKGPSTEELFFVAGVIFQIPTASTSQASQPPTETSRKSNELPFQFQITTQFSEFKPNMAVVHKVSRETTGLINEITPEPNLFPHLIPARIDVIRFGFELFENTRKGLFFSFFPQIRQRFYFAADSTRIDILISEEDMSNDNQLPFENLGLLQFLSSSLEKANVCTGFMSRIRDLLAENKSTRIVWQGPV